MTIPERKRFGFPMAKIGAVRNAVIQNSIIRLIPTNQPFKRKRAPSNLTIVPKSYSSSNSNSYSV